MNHIVEVSNSVAVDTAIGVFEWLKMPLWQ